MVNSIFLGKEFRSVDGGTNLKVFTHVPVDERIEATMDHGQIVHAERGPNMQIVALLRLHLDRTEVDDQGEQLQWEPAHDERDNDQYHHFDHLQKTGSKVNCGQLFAFTADAYLDLDVPLVSVARQIRIARRRGAHHVHGNGHVQIEQTANGPSERDDEHKDGELLLLHLGQHLATIVQCFVAMHEGDRFTLKQLNTGGEHGHGPDGHHVARLVAA